MRLHGGMMLAYRSALYTSAMPRKLQLWRMLAIFSPVRSCLRVVVLAHPQINNHHSSLLNPQGLLRHLISCAARLAVDENQ